MYMYNHGTGGHPQQGHGPNVAYATATGYPANPAFMPPPGFITANAAATSSMSVSVQVQIPIPTLSHTPTPPSRALTPVPVPPGYYPIELVQFWRGQAHPLHWALFVRTTPHTSAFARAKQTPHGNFYEVVGSPETYTAQFLSAVTFSPETLPDWRGTHVIGWVHPAQLGTFERAVKQVPVWRRRPEWRCQEWVWEVVCALRGGQGVFVGEGCSWAGLQRQMAKLLEAWENGDI